MSGCEAELSHVKGQVDDGWWEIRRTAQYIGMSVAFVRKSVRFGTIPFVRVGAKSIRFSKSEIEDWLRRGGIRG